MPALSARQPARTSKLPATNEYERPPGIALGGRRYASPINTFAVTSREGRGGPQRNEAGARCAVNIQYVDAGPTGVEGAGGTGGPGCGARGWRRGLAGLRDDAPNHASATRRHWCGGRRRERRGLAAVPVGGGGAWPGFETTRRAQLAARTASGRAAAHGHAKQPGPAGGRARQRPEHPWGTQSSPAQQVAGPCGAWNTSGLRCNGVPTAALPGPS